MPNWGSTSKAYEHGLAWSPFPECLQKDLQHTLWAAPSAGHLHRSLILFVYIWGTILHGIYRNRRHYCLIYMLCSYLYYTMVYQLIQLLFCPSSITCVNSMDASYIPIAEARDFTTHWISKISTHRVEILQYLNYFLNLYFPFPWPDTGSIISACTKLERCFEAPDDHCFHQIIIACKRRFIIYHLCKKICDIFTRSPIKNLFLSWDNLP